MQIKQVVRAAFCLPPFNRQAVSRTHLVDQFSRQTGPLLFGFVLQGNDGRRNTGAGYIRGNDGWPADVQCSEVGLVQGGKARGIAQPAGSLGRGIHMYDNIAQHLRSSDDQGMGRTLVTRNVCMSPSGSFTETYSPGRRTCASRRKTVSSSSSERGS